MRQLVEIEFNDDKELSNNCVIIRNKNKWKVIDKTAFLDNIERRLNNTNKELVKEEHNRTLADNEITFKTDALVLILKHILGFIELPDEKIREILNEPAEEEVVEDEQD